MNNSTLLSAPKVGITTAELWTHLVVFYVFLCGVISTFGNSLIIRGIWRSKKLRSRFFVTVGTLAFCRVLLCVQFLIIGSYRIFRTVGVAPSNLSRLICHSIHFWLMVGLTLEMMLLLTLVCDRALAILAHAFYRNLTVRQALIACAVQYLFALIIKLPFSYSGVNLNEKISCVNSYSAPSDAFNLYTQNVDLILLSVIIALYVILILIVKHRVRSIRNASNSESAMMALKRQIKLMPMLRNLVIAHCSLSLISKILRTLAGVYQDQPETSARFTAYGGVFSTLDLFSNMVALLWSNKDIRTASSPCRKDNNLSMTTNVNDITNWNKITVASVNRQEMTGRKKGPSKEQWIPHS